MTTPKLHLFICTTCSFDDDKGKPCAADTAATFRSNLKTMCKNEFGKDELRVNSSGCLGQCEHGIASVLYPAGEWNLNLRPGDETRLLERLRELKPQK